MGLYFVKFEGGRVSVNHLPLPKFCGKKSVTFGDTSIPFFVRRSTLWLHISGIQMGVGYELRFNDDLKHFVRWDPDLRQFRSSRHGKRYKVAEGYLLTVSSNGVYWVIVSANRVGQATMIARSVVEKISLGQ
jgi:hypothetical protein